jgi:site-specific DNA-methyltransferase (adenine-specific)
MIRPLLEKNQDTFVRFNEAIGIVRKIEKFQEKSFESITSTRKPFGFDSQVIVKEEAFENSAKIYSYPKNGFVAKNKIIKNEEWLYKYKVFIAKAYGERGSFPYLVLSKPFVGEIGSCCSETYLLIGTFDSIKETTNVMSYMTTKFFRFLVLLKKSTQNAPKAVYSFVPMQNFNESWTDEKLYKKYDLSKEEIDFIESMIKPMDLNTKEEEEI